ncbi:uncharacterized protein K02A2.6-like [Hydractinia symbiolongicarpus]|uniref:uncharacterized protein K02A2.6-like n=1 Tax=Hydractinia symbiolongicarpus TaxID=13093 RepID=UPI002550CC6F|nr:uncharacterized protein K02A2.6-like [Hydractinia symbiolongicarpus]
MARAVDISCPPHFDTNGDVTSLGTRWKRWRNGFDLYLVAAGITDNTQKKALLLHCAGEDLRELFDTLPEPEAADGQNDYVKACTALDTYFLPKKNKRYERHVFRTCAQKESESISQYVTRLRTLAKTCEFRDIDDEIVDQVIEKCTSRKLRKRLLKESELTLVKLCDIATIMEAADHQVAQYTKSTLSRNQEDEDSEQDDVNFISRKIKRTGLRKSGIAKTPPTIHTGPSQNNQPYCYRCGKKDHRADKCIVTKGKSCHKCGIQGHFSNVCQSTKATVRYVTADTSSSDDDFVLAIDNDPNCPNHKNSMYPVDVDGQRVNVLIDSGSTINVISKSTLSALKLKSPILPYHKKVFAFGASSPLKVNGCIWVVVGAGEKVVSTRFVVVPQSSVTILGVETACKLDLLRVGPGGTMNDKVNHISTSEDGVLKQLLCNYGDRFEGLGKLKDVNLKIQIDPTVTPVAQKARRLPILMQQQLDMELEKLLELGVIEPIESPPSWVNPLVIVPKKTPSDGIRMCVDMRVANTAVIREPYQIPTLEEVLHEFNGCTVFTKLDLNKGYHQIALDEASRDLTAFATHRGIFRFTRLIYGIASAAEQYQRELELALSGLSKVRNISDDIIIGGTSNQDLLDRMQCVFERLREKNLTVNLKKCEFLKTELIYMGHKLSKDGIAPDERKVRAIADLKPPTNVKELQSFLGMVTYCSKFLPHFSTVTAPLRQLLSKDTKWSWGDAQRQAFNDLKIMLLSSATLAYYQPDAYTEIFTDASPVGLGAVIMQRQPDGILKPIGYASRSLLNAETRYSQIEKECLAILFAIERFRIYLYGIEFVVKTDHKPLVTMFSPRRKQLPPRIERWVMRLMPYAFKVEYHPGRTNGADYLSRSNPMQDNTPSHRMTEEFVNFIQSKQLPVAIPKKDIRDAQNDDPAIALIKKHLASGTIPKLDVIREYYPSRLQLSIVNDILMFANKIVIPPTLRESIISIAHEGHQGQVRTKQRLRKKVWWPRMGFSVEAHIKSCHGCQVTAGAQIKTPVVMTEIPDSAWLMLGCDLCGPFPTGEHLLVCIDYYSRYPEVEIIRRITAANIVDKLRKMFCRYGAPEIIVTDNGPQFRSNTDFATLMKEFGVEHRKVTPYHPEANGEVERFNRNLKKTIQAAIAENQNWRTALQNYLLAYRTTPHATTGATPAELLFNRPVKDKLPASTTSSKNTMSVVKNRDRIQKERIAKYADKRNNARSHVIQPGQKVLVANQSTHRNKFTPRWRDEPCTVTAVKGNAIFIEDGTKTMMRTSSHVKPYFMRNNQRSNKRHLQQPTVTTDSATESSDDDFDLPPTVNDPGNETDLTSSDDTVVTESPSRDETIAYGEEEVNDEELFVPNRNTRTRNVKPPPRFKDFVTAWERCDICVASRARGAYMPSDIAFAFIFCYGSVGHCLADRKMDLKSKHMF